jgi:hypothetical protein
METRETMHLVKVDAPIEARKCCLTGSKFLDVNLGEAVFDDVKFGRGDDQECEPVGVAA